MWLTSGKISSLIIMSIAELMLLSEDEARTSTKSKISSQHTALAQPAKSTRQLQSFNLFPVLPSELRLAIWLAVADLRVLHVVAQDPSWVTDRGKKSTFLPLSFSTNGDPGQVFTPNTASHFPCICSLLKYKLTR